MEPRRLGPGDYRRMPWKNGGGETVEVAIWPHGAGLDAFEWRVSLARVAANGPFSLFPGIDRTLSLVEGRGIDLAFGDGETVSLAPADEPYSFAADVPVAGRLHDGPIVDLNVMSRRGAVVHRAMRIGAPVAIEVPSGALALLYCHQGGAVADEIFALAAEETLFLGEGVHRVTPGGGGTFAIMLRPEHAASIR